MRSDLLMTLFSPNLTVEGNETILKGGGGESRSKAIRGEILAALGILCVLMFAIFVGLYI